MAIIQRGDVTPVKICVWLSSKLSENILEWSYFEKRECLTINKSNKTAENSFVFASSAIEAC